MEPHQPWPARGCREGAGRRRARAAPLEHALIRPLALNGLRVSEATSADIEAAWHRARAPYLGDHPQGRQGRPPSRSHPAPRGRSTWPSASAAKVRLPRPRWAAAGPARRRPDRTPGRPPRRNHQARGPHTLRHAFITAALDAGRAAAGRTGSRLPRRPAHHHDIRPGHGLAGPARYLHRRRVRRRSRPVRGSPPRTSSAWPVTGQADTATALDINRHHPVTVCESMNAREPPICADVGSMLIKRRPSHIRAFCRLKSEGTGDRPQQCRRAGAVCRRGGRSGRCGLVKS